MNSKDTILETVAETLNHQADVLKDLAKSVSESDYQSAIKIILECEGKVIISGMGKSGIVGSKTAASLASNGVESFFLHPGEAYHGDLGMIGKKDAVILISNSGETDEVLKIQYAIKQFGNPIIAITCNRSSTLSKNADATLLINVDRESCPNNLAPTASTTATLAIGDALVCTLIKLRKFTPLQFARLHPGGSLGRKLLSKVKDEMISNNLPIASSNDNLKHAVCLATRCRIQGIIIIKDAEKLIGCVTDGDIRRAIENDHGLDVKLEKVIKKGCISVDQDESVSIADELLIANNIHHLVVTDGEDVVGIYQQRIA